MIILAAIIASCVIFLTVSDRNCTVTISATFRLPAGEDDSERYHTVYPAHTAAWTAGEHGAAPVPARIVKGDLKASAGYGPVGLEGTFPYDGIISIWPDAPLDRDWPFSVSLFNCHTEGNGYRMYFDVQADTETGDATADLYIYANGAAHPETAHWEGKAGEKIELRTDF